jgi:hypothetical protein
VKPIGQGVGESRGTLLSQRIGIVHQGVKEQRLAFARRLIPHRGPNIGQQPTSKPKGV